MKKRIIAILLSIGLLLSLSCMTVFADSEVFQMGDADLNGKVNAEDARRALRQSVALESFTADSKEFRLMDMTGDKKITAEDARLILRTAVALETPVNSDISVAGEETGPNEYDIFRGGNFYAEGTMQDSNGATPLQMAITPDSAYVMTDFEGIDMGILISGGKMYLIYPAEKMYLEMDKAFMATVGLNIDDIVNSDDLNFSELKPLSEASTVTKANLNGKECTKYTFPGADGTQTNVYMDGNKLVAIESLVDGAVIETTFISSITAEVPADYITPPASYKKANTFEFMMLLIDVIG